MPLYLITDFSSVETDVTFKVTSISTNEKSIISTEAYLELSQKVMMKLFAKIANGFLIVISYLHNY